MARWATCFVMALTPIIMTFAALPSRLCGASWRTPTRCMTHCAARAMSSHARRRCWLQMAGSCTGLLTIREAGFYSMLADMAETVDAAHRSGAVCLIAHPGRHEQGFTFYDPDLLDQVRAEIPLDGIEVYHPYHRPEMVETYLEYVRKHNLLLSTGSDSHSLPGRMPIKHRAKISRQLLERVGIQVT